MADDDLTAALEGIEGRWAARKQYSLGFDPVDAPRLLAAVRAVLELHAPHLAVVRNICPAHAGGMRDRRFATLKAYRDEVDACPDCRKEEVRECTGCQGVCPDDDRWPCPTVQAITRELTGKDPDHAQT